jgi:hypothetical protein
MNILIRRYGIVIKSIAIDGEKASIGSGPDSDIVIDDPYLSAHVADLVKKPDGWHLVDAGTSLEGITREGARVEDELILPGQLYSVGGFELLAEGVAGSAPVASREASVVPSTVADVPMPQGYLPTIAEGVAVPRGVSDVPKTMFEAPMPQSVRPQPARSPAEMVRPPQSPAPAAAQRGAAAPSPDAKKKRLRIIAGAFGGATLLLLLLVLLKGDKKEPVAKKVETPATSTAAPPASTTAPAASDAVQLLAALKYDEALALWETQLDRTTDATLRKRYSELAMEIGRLHAAKGSPKAKEYFEKVAKWGEGDLAAEAKRRLGT